MSFNEVAYPQRLNKKQRRVLKQQGVEIPADFGFRQHFKIRDIEPLTDNQATAFRAFDQGKHLMLHGIAGTGKSFISNAMAIKEVLKPHSPYKKVVIIRSVVPSRDMGFMPGKMQEKTKVYELPYYQIYSNLFGRGDAYEVLKSKGYVEFESTSFLRGTTFDNAIIIPDEIQNMSGHELDTVITRIGDNCRIMLCGDYRQSDFVHDRDRGGLINFMKIIERMDDFEFVEFDEHDICRSKLVKDYIIAKDRLKIKF